jgi:hypothetical protein
MNKLTNCTVVLLSLCLLTSCSSKIFGGKKSRKKGDVVKQTPTDTTRTATTLQQAVATTTIPVATPGAKPLIDELTPIWNKRMSYTTFSGKAKVNLEGPDLSYDLIMNFRVEKDKKIWAHISALGGLVSVARIYVTPDSFFMLNYTEKEATRLPLRDAAKVLPIPVRFSQLQNLMLGEPLADGVITNAESKELLWSLHTEDSNYIQNINYRKADSLMTLGHLDTRMPNGPHAMIEYNNYEAVNNRKVSTNRVVRIQNGVNNYTLDMNISNPEFDKELEFPFSIPGNYTIKNN